MNRILVRALGVVSLAALAVGYTAGCAADDPPVNGRYRDVSPDQITVTVFKTDKLVALERKQERLRAECMAGRGFTQLTKMDAPVDSQPFVDLNVTPPAFAVQTEDAARQYGFGKNEPAQPAHVISSDPAFDRAFEQCGTVAAEKIGVDFPRVRSQLYELINKINVEVTRMSMTGPAAGDFDRMTAPLLDCLDRHDFHGSGEQKRSLDSYGVGRPMGQVTGPEPAAPKKIPGTVEILPPVAERTYVPTPAESALAVATTRCAREIGYAEKYVAHRLAVVRDVLTSHEAQLVRVTGRLDELAAAQAA